LNGKRGRGSNVPFFFQAIAEGARARNSQFGEGTKVVPLENRRALRAVEPLTFAGTFNA
jgi:hypothetical protein